LSVGASGAIFGLAGALAASYYLGEFSLPSGIMRGPLRSLIFFIGFNVLFGIGYNIFAGSSGGVDNGAHIGGLLSGAALGAIIARFAPQSDAPLRRATMIGVVALAVLAAGLGVRDWRGRPMRMARAFEALANGDSISRLQELVRDEPNSAQLHGALAQAYYNRQQFPQAEAEFKRFLELQPENLSARFDLGMSYLNDKRYDDAKSTFSQMLAQDAKNAEGHYGLGLVLAGQENDQAAIDEFKAAAAQPSQISSIYYAMGSSYMKLKKYDEAIAAYQKEKDSSGDDPDLESALADAYQAKGMTQQAEEARNKAEQMKGGANR
jgi:tetratricopeptide (TPR) repeat protein